MNSNENLIRKEIVLCEYDDAIGRHHLIVSEGNGTGTLHEYVTSINCPNCGRRFTENMVCECGRNNAANRP